MHTRSSHMGVALLAILFLSASLAISGAAQNTNPNTVRVIFILRNLNITGTPGTEPDRPSKTVQRTQFLVFNLNGGVPPWRVESNNGIVSVVKTGENVFKIVPNSLGST